MRRRQVSVDEEAYQLVMEQTRHLLSPNPKSLASKAITIALRDDDIRDTIRRYFENEMIQKRKQMYE